MMNQYCEQWISDWCVEHGWTDWFQESRSYWAFPPQAVMPTPIPATALQAMKAEKGLSRDEKQWFLGAIASLVSGGILSFAIDQPLPFLLGFTVCALIVGHLDDE